jgi:hypothetical protein
MWTETTRPQYERKGSRYSSDVSDAEWAVISPHLPERRRFGRPPKTALRKRRRCAAGHGQDRLSVAAVAA